MVLAITFNFKIRTPYEVYNLIRISWNATFIPYHEEVPERFLFIHYFLGFPPVGNKQFIEILLYFLLGGFIFTPLKNLVKLVTELPLALLHYAIAYIEDSLKEKTSFFGNLSYIGLRILSPLVLIGYFLVRTITSPVASAREAAKHHALLGVFSILCSIAGLAAITIALAPAIATLASSLGLTSILTLAATSGLSPLATGFVFALAKLGISASLPLVGAAIVATFSAIMYAINSVREYSIELLSNPKYMLSLDQNLDASDNSDTWVDMIESGLTSCYRKKISIQKEENYPWKYSKLFKEKDAAQKSFENHAVLNMPG